MRSVAVVASSLAFVASVTAQVPGFAAMSAPAEGEQVPAGSTYTVKWEAGQYTGNVQITLLGGETPGTLQVDGVIASSVRITDESYNWNVDCKLGEKATYGIQITSEANPATFQYSFPFHIDNSKCGASAGESSSGKPAEYPTSAPPVSSSTISVTTTGYPTISPPKQTQSVTEGEPEIPSAASSYEAVPTEQPTTQNTTQYPITQPPTTLLPTSNTTFVTSASVTSVEPIATAAAGRNAVSLAAIGGIVAAVFAL
ncbi:hypothetical protein DL766_008851 [Monosporascus sp. MC13-8B]|uniref:Yeast cell wall synthesis Kre9/Knh1-like N-terminal domain-containing protein n=1 Tax=Monosporascus cannonballus TaxID=155416 RepID=A0ABY0GQY6_9PEZI|nr:hypothetical protein DL762_010676 [Monosporascus cannonballus]RYO94941.1 hypothetical protein DL763_003837 [Monosporascus cannonballus]RYP17681.1 hypothetical protein DL766_008851 [Monosporascus sp. MC13-8B]